MNDDYITDEARGDGWTLLLGDACERLGELDTESAGLSVYSPPFGSLYTYSPSPRDVGNCATRDEFFTHYGYVIRELHRLTKPGRISAVHTADVMTTKATHGQAGLYDFPGDVIRAHTAAGWVYYGRVMISKNPQAQAVRSKAHHLLFVTKNKDASKSSPAIGDSLLIFRKPGDGEPVATDVTNDEWIQWAHPVWLDIRETRTLNTTGAREDADEKHLHALQLGLIERCVRLWSNPGELVLSPFAGIGSEGYEAIRYGRRYHGVELKKSYFEVARRNLAAAEAGNRTGTLFEEASA